MKIRLFIKSFNNNLIKQASNEIKLFLENNLSTKKDNFISLPTKIKRFCVLRSPHIDKDSREHFEIRLYKKFIVISLNSSELLELILNLNLPLGVNSFIQID